MSHNDLHDDYDDLGPHTPLDFDAAEPVEFAPDFHWGLMIPFRDGSLEMLEEMADELGITSIEAAEQLIQEGLAARSASRSG